MKQEIKQQVFDVLNQGRIRVDPLGDRFMFKYQAGSAIWILSDINDIPDDIETRMLDWLEEKEHGIGIKLLLKLITITNPSKTFTFYDWREKDKSRPVAIAEACVWVYQQLNANKQGDQNDESYKT